MRRHLRTTRGTALLESIIYIGVLAFVLLAAAGFAQTIAAGQVKTIAYEEAVRNAQFALARVALEIREAHDVNVGASTFGSSPGVLSLATSSGATNPTVFDVSGGQLRVKLGAGAAEPLTSTKVTVQEFQVDNLSVSGKTKVIRAHLRVIHQNASSPIDFKADVSMDTTARLNRHDGFSN